MPTIINIALNTTPEQASRLKALQQAFSAVCNALAPVVRESRCWNRVALHHMTYRTLREKFPQMGSQMVCNAIYSVSRTSRVVYQAPTSPFNVNRWGQRRLPLIQFNATSPVYFDRHTLSLKAGHLSMFTLDGRMRFELQIKPEDERRFHGEKLQEIVLSSVNGSFSLSFAFADSAAAEPSDEAELPEYVIVQPDAPELAAALAPPDNLQTGDFA